MVGIRLAIIHPRHGRRNRLRQKNIVIYKLTKLFIINYN